MLEKNLNTPALRCAFAELRTPPRAEEEEANEDTQQIQAEIERVRQELLEEDEGASCERNCVEQPSPAGARQNMLHALNRVLHSIILLHAGSTQSGCNK